MASVGSASVKGWAAGTISSWAKEEVGSWVEEEEVTWAEVDGGGAAKIGNEASILVAALEGIKPNKNSELEL